MGASVTISFGLIVSSWIWSRSFGEAGRGWSLCGAKSTLDVDMAEGRRAASSGGSMAGGRWPTGPGAYGRGTRQSWSAAAWLVKIRRGRCSQGLEFKGGNEKARLFPVRI